MIWLYASYHILKTVSLKHESKGLKQHADDIMQFSDLLIIVNSFWSIQYT